LSEYVADTLSLTDDDHGAVFVQPDQLHEILKVFLVRQHACYPVAVDQACTSHMFVTGDERARDVSADTGQSLLAGFHVPCVHRCGGEAFNVASYVKDSHPGEVFSSHAASTNGPGSWVAAAISLASSKTASVQRFTVVFIDISRQGEVLVEVPEL